MRLTRLLLLVVVAAAIAGVAVPKASALAFDDNVCPVGTGTEIKVCPQGTTGNAYSVRLKGREGTGCVPYVSFSTVGALPTGLTLSSSGLISGTPTQPGEWTFWVSMKDVPASEGGVSWCGDSKSTERQFSITVVSGLSILQASVPGPAYVSEPYSVQLSTNPGGATWSVQSGALPPGIGLASTGLLSGTPTAAGDFSFVVGATTGSTTATRTFSIKVLERLKVTNPIAVPPAEVGRIFSLGVKATGGTGAHTWAVVGGTLPAGLSLDSATGLISGKPQVAGSFSVKVSVADGFGQKDTVDVTIGVAPKLAILKRALPALKVGTVYAAKLAAIGGVGPLKWNILGGRPGLLSAGIKFNAKTGAFSGTPKKAGIYRLRMQVVDKLGVKSALGIVLKVNA